MCASSHCEQLHGERTYAVHRAGLLETVKAAVPHEGIRLGSRCTAVHVEPDGALLRFADGGRAGADVVIGADSVHSVVRAAVTEPTPPEYSGNCAFRTTVVGATATPALPGGAPAPCEAGRRGPDRRTAR